MRNLQIPFTEEQVRSLGLGEAVLLSGILYTARDAAHRWLAALPAPENPPPIAGGVLYHCGPVVVSSGNGDWQITAAGPTTSAREEVYEADVIRRYGIRGIIGKGGMGEATAAACRECGCVYFSAVGGAAQVLAQAIVRVRNVFQYEEFGAPEALWELEVRNFPVIVTMDAKGGSLHQQVLEESLRRYRNLQRIRH